MNDKTIVMDVFKNKIIQLIEESILKMTSKEDCTDITKQLFFIGYIMYRHSLSLESNRYFIDRLKFIENKHKKEINNLSISFDYNIMNNIDNYLLKLLNYCNLDKETIIQEIKSYE